MSTTTAPAPAEPGLASETRPPNRSRLYRSFGLQIAVDLGLLLALVYSCVWWALGLRPATPWRVPWAYSGDAISGAAMIKSLVSDGGVQTEPLLGYPFGFELYDFPVGGDNLNLGLIRFIGQTGGGFGEAMNGFYLLTFGTIAISAWAVLRRLGVARWTAIACAVIYATLPYHYLRNEGHLLLGAYHSVPIGCYLALRHLDMEPLLFDRRRRRMAAQFALTLAAAVLLGSAGGYYAVFTIVLVGSAGAAAALRWRSPKHLVSAALVSAMIGGTLLFNTLPTLRYRAENGVNEAVAQRPLGDSDRYGLRIVDMIRPIGGHRSNLFDNINAEIEEQSVLHSEGGMQAVGGAASIGLFIAMGHLLAGPRRRSSTNPASDAEPAAAEPVVADIPADDISIDDISIDDRLISSAGALAIVCVLVGSVSGLSWYVRMAGLEDVRAWNRISVFVAFFGLVVLATTIDRGLQRLPQRYGGPIGLLCALAVVLIGAWDQTPVGGVRLDEPVLVQATAQDRALVASMETQMDQGAAIFQLPIIPFPEGGAVGDMAPENHLRFYLWSDDLHWSYGGMRGREWDWQLQLRDVEPPDLIDQIIAMGFTGMYLDRFGYEDRGEEIESTLAAFGLVPAFVSSDNRTSFYDLSAIAAQVDESIDEAETQRRRAFLTHEALTTTFSDEFRGLERLDDLTWRWARDAGTVTVANPGSAPRDVSISFTVQTHGSDTTVTLNVPGAPARSNTLEHDGSYDTTVSLAANEELVLHFASEEGDLIPLDAGAFAAFRVVNPQFNDLSVPEFSNGVIDVS